MNTRLLWVSISILGACAVASPTAFAQRGGGGHGGGMGGGMPSAAQPGGRMGALPSPQSSERPSAQAGTDRSAASERGSASGKTAGELLQQNTKLSENLGKLLPAGTDLQAAAAGFKNLGEFVAAVHVSNNLGIPFASLKADMMTGDSLGQAIRKLRPDADAEVETRRARAQASAHAREG